MHGAGRHSPQPGLSGPGHHQGAVSSPLSTPHFLAFDAADSGGKLFVAFRRGCCRWRKCAHVTTSRGCNPSSISILRFLSSMSACLNTSLPPPTLVCILFDSVAFSRTQGCMNNVTFGNERVSYYETVAGGAGAGPGWHGRSGVHTHMTNTRITDPEVFSTLTSLKILFPSYLSLTMINYRYWSVAFQLF